MSVRRKKLTRTEERIRNLEDFGFSVIEICGSLQKENEELKVNLACTQGMLEKTQQQLGTDELTGLPTRRRLSEFAQIFAFKVEREIFKSPVGVQKTDLVLMRIDVDDFKKINDTEGVGHPGGDEVFCAIARHLKGSLRRMDVVGRVGGDEFTAICPETTLQGLIHHFGGNIEKGIKARIPVLDVEYQGHKIPVTFSAGIAVYRSLKPLAGEGPAEKVMRGIRMMDKNADRALYLSKKHPSGKGWIAVYEE